MPRTDNQKAVSAYLPLPLYDQLAQFKLDEGLRSDSQAIAVILERFFQSPIQPVEIKNNGSVDRLTSLEHTVLDLVAKVQALYGTVYATVPSDVPDTVPSDVPSTVNSDVPSDVPSTVNSDVPSIVIYKADRNYPDDFSYWRFWSGEKRGFTENLKLAVTYKSHDAVVIKAKKLLSGSYAPSADEEMRYKTLAEVKAAIAEQQAKV